MLLYAFVLPEGRIQAARSALKLPSRAADLDQPGSVEQESMRTRKSVIVSQLTSELLNLGLKNIKVGTPNDFS
jgi:hypothetical protein